MKKIIPIILCSLIIFSSINLFITPSTKGSLDESNTWSYYKSISIIDNLENGIGRIHIIKGSGTDNTSNGTVYIPSAYWEDFPNDTRFGSTIDPSTAVQLPQYLESLSNADAVYYVNLTSGNYSTIYLFVGNANVDLYTNGEEVFYAFENFTGWDTYAGNPIADDTGAGNWDSSFFNSPRVCKNKSGSAYIDGNDRIYIYYSGSGDNSSQSQTHNEDTLGLVTADKDNPYSVTRVAYSNCTMTSSDYLEMYDGQIMAFGNNGQADTGANGWDDADCQIGTIIYDEDESIFRMWYAGNQNSASDDVSLGYANSTDGVNWTKINDDSGPTGSNPSSWGVTKGSHADSSMDLYSACVIWDDSASKWKMWYAGQSSADSDISCCYANSTDGINWTKYNNGQSVWDPSYKIFPNEVWKTASNEYHMTYYYYNTGNGIGYANSSDGISWESQGWCLLKDNEDAHTERTFWCSQVEINNTWYTYYSGQNSPWLGIADSSMRLPRTVYWEMEDRFADSSHNQLRVASIGTGYTHGARKDYNLPSEDLTYETTIKMGETIGTGDYVYWHIYGIVSNKLFGFRVTGTNDLYYLDGGSWTGSGEGLTNDIEYGLKIDYTSGTVSYYLDNSLLDSGCTGDTTATTDRVTYGSSGLTTESHYFDDLKVYNQEFSISSYGSLTGVGAGGNISFQSINSQANNTILQDQNRTFNWTKVDNATKYHLQISNSSTFSTTFVNLSDIDESTYGVNYTEYGNYVIFVLTSQYNITWYGYHYYRVRAYAR